MAREDKTSFPITADFLAGRSHNALSGDDRAALEALFPGVDTRAAGTLLVRAGDPVSACHLLADGIVLRSVRREDRRFVVGMHVPGDFLDLHGMDLDRLDHDLVAAGGVRVAATSHERLRKATSERPALARALGFASQLDAAIHRHWIVRLEELDAPRRIAHLYAELHTRLTLIGRAPTGALHTPFTQFDLADMCGITAIHANRAVARLREQGLADIRRGDLYTADWERLKAYARFDPDYLFGTGSYAKKAS